MRIRQEMKCLASRGPEQPSSRQGWKQRRFVGLSLFLVFAVSPASLRGFEGNGIAPLVGESLGKSFRTGSWDRNAPVDIHSEEMTVDFENRRIVFKGDVKVVQSDFSLAANEVTAVFGKSAEDIRKIVATGDVSIEKANKRAWGERATYDRENATILLEGNPVLKQGSRILRWRCPRPPTHREADQRPRPMVHGASALRRTIPPLRARWKLRNSTY